MGWENYEKEFCDNVWIKNLTIAEPTELLGIHIFEFKQVLSEFQNGNRVFIDDLVTKLAKGAFVILRNSFDLDELDTLKDEFNILEEGTASAFHKMLEGVPNYWRDITDELSSKYAVPVVKKSAYFFPMNQDSNNVYKIVYPKWRLLKALSGLSPFEYEGLTPKDGKVDRIQIVKYPPGSGYLDAHHDPSHNQRLIMSAYLTKRGVDFTGGGFWAIVKGEGKKNFEDMLEVGDIGVCYAHIIHGVDSSEKSENGGNEKPFGDRWFMGLYTNDSDEIQNRRTLKKAKI
jgi:hypothetical protein